MDTRSTVIGKIESVAEQQGKPLVPLHDAVPLLETGLDSLCMAIIVAQLEDELDVDPFDTEEEFDFPVTIGDFVTLYEQAAARHRT